MLGTLRRPLPVSVLIAGTAAAGALVALYCIVYTSLAGRPETLASTSGWAIANVCPWLVAIEAGKRMRDVVGASVVLLAACALSMLFGYLLTSTDQLIAFELIRRLPSMAGSAAAIALLRSGLGRSKSAAEPLPLMPSQIEWVRSAGNYIEIKAADRTVIRRQPLSDAERELARHGFVRIHRSTLVRKDRIARVRPEDVVLVDGTHLKVGKRYRAALN